MRIILHRNAKKRYGKLTELERRRFKERRNLFLEDPFHPLLNNHALHGAYRGYRSINITGNLRAIYEEINSDTAHFIALGTHPELYE
jgi:addiction module RelE/StbE family toxin